MRRETHTEEIDFWACMLLIEWEQYYSPVELALLLLLSMFLALLYFSLEYAVALTVTGRHTKLFDNMKFLRSISRGLLGRFATRFYSTS